MRHASGCRFACHQSPLIALFSLPPMVRLLLILMLGLSSQGAFASPPLVNAQQVSAGGYHVCAIVNGGAQCWGYNYNGQLGNGNFVDSEAPVPVRGLGSGVTAITSGGYHSCAIVSGAVKCWGRNPDGELGNGSVVDSNVPVTVAGLTGVTAIRAGEYHTCAVISGGSVRCWGWNAYGQLGDGSTTATNTGTPATVSSISGVTMLAVAGVHTCALIGGAVKCWGYNAYGELGNGSIADSHVPVAVSALTSGVTSIAAGLYHTCAIVSGGGVRCWGYNSNGQLGDNTLVSTGINNPVNVSGIASGATGLAGGGYHTCVLVNGAEKCWGYNFFGQLGNGTLTESHVPVAVTGLAAGVTAVTAGAFLSCSQVTVGATSLTKCWGDNVDGEMGLGDHLFQSQPVPVTGLASGATMLAASSVASHSCAIVAGAAKCWGDNANGALGNGNTYDSSVPVAVTGLTSGVTAIADGAYHTCAVVSGKAMCWGWNANGQLGDASIIDRTTPVTAIASGVTAVSAGYSHTCAIVSGGVKCWGKNTSGELGNASIAESHVPVAVLGLSGTVIAISVGVAHTCAVISSGKVQCWGYNSNGQLGNGTNVATLINPPVTVSNIASGATAIAAGGYHTCAIVSGGVQCWGDGQAGALGNGGVADSFVPVQATGLTAGVGSIVAGNTYSCAIVSGNVYCWGNTYSLGNGASNLLLAPALIPLGGTVTSIGTGYAHGCGIIGGVVACVGADNFGQLGDGRDVFLETAGIVVEADEIFSDGFQGP